jgi:Flp pilus assembly protein TadD
VPGDAEEAARLAERACELTGYQQPLMLDTLAIAYGAAGRVQEAVTTAQQALQLAQANGQTRLVAGIKQRLESYRQRLR